MLINSRVRTPILRGGSTSSMGCVVFKWGGTKLERFLTKNQRTRRKLLNFENWVNGEVSKSAKI